MLPRKRMAPTPGKPTVINSCFVGRQSLLKINPSDVRRIVERFSPGLMICDAHVQRVLRFKSSWRNENAQRTLAESAVPIISVIFSDPPKEILRAPEVQVLNALKFRTPNFSKRSGGAQCEVARPVSIGRLNSRHRMPPTRSEASQVLDGRATQRRPNFRHLTRCHELRFETFRFASFRNSRHLLQC